MATKVCTKCGEEKMLGKFNRNCGMKDGYRNSCKLCDAEYQQERKKEIAERKRKYYQEHKEEITERCRRYNQEHKKEKAEYNQMYRLKHKERLSEYRKKYGAEYYRTHKKETRAYDLMRLYGISQEEYDKILKKQNGCCAICHTNNSGSRAWHVDHDHETGRVRGILCSSCNTGLGFMKNNPTNFHRAAYYLESSTIENLLDVSQVRRY